MFHSNLLLSNFYPEGLFGSGEKGVWFDPSDFSTMFQDSGGATPVTAVGQAVGRINDKSGNGYHATQATAASRPILRQDAGGRYYLEFDGVDDSLATASIDPNGADKVQAVIGLRKVSDAAFACFLETGPSINTTNGTIAFFAPLTASGANYSFGSRGTTLRNPVVSTYTAPITNVYAVVADIATPFLNTRVNGGAGIFNNTLTQGTGTYLTQPLNIGRRNGATSPFNGWMYGLIIRFSLFNLSTSVIADAEDWMNSKTGAY